MPDELTDYETVEARAVCFSVVDFAKSQRRKSIAEFISSLAQGAVAAEHEQWAENETDPMQGPWLDGRIHNKAAIAAAGGTSVGDPASISSTAAPKTTEKPGRYQSRKS